LESNIAVNERHKTLTAEQVSNIVAAIRQQVPLAEVAVKCGVSISTVYRQRRIHHLRSQSAKTEGLDLKRNLRRAEWTRAVDCNMNRTIKSVRSTTKTAYAWLYRNDRSWLQANCTQLRRTKTHRLTVDWPKRDLELCEKLNLYVATLKLDKMRPRISKSLMLNHIGEASVRENGHKLPKTYALLDELEESVLDRQMALLHKSSDGEG
jgi:hypothetical protein